MSSMNFLDRKAIREAIKAAGGFTTVARMMQPPISRQAVWQWGHDTDVPAKRVKQLCEITNLDPKQVRPDIF